MTPEIAVDLFREALWLTALIVGLLVISYVPSLSTFLPALVYGR